MAKAGIGEVVDKTEKHIDKNELSMTKADLTEMMATLAKTIIEEQRKPTEKELKQQAKEESELRARNEERASNAQAVMEQRAQVEAQKRICTHSRRDGSVRAVIVNDDLGGYLLCQGCQAVIRPGIAPENYKGTAIFNTDLFNRLFQMAQPSIFA